MVNYSILYGTGNYCEDSKFTSKIVNGLPDDWHVYVLKRFDTVKCNIPQRAVKVEYLYAHPVFRDNLSKSEIEDIESWLGYPFRLLSFHSRVIPYKRGVSLEKVYECFAKIVIASREFFESNSIEAITTTMVSEPSALIPLIVAKRLGIKTLMLLPGRLRPSMIIGDYNKTFIPRIKEFEFDEDEYEKEIRHPLLRKSEPVAADIMKRTKFTHNINPVKDAPYKISQLRQYKKWYNSQHPCERLFNYTPLELTNIALKVFYRKIYSKHKVQKPDFQQEYFLFPMHYMIDANMLTQEPFVDQIELIKNISKVLPSDIKLYVRPHPHWFASDIPVKRLKEILKLPNVRFISYKANIYKLIQNSLGVFTINSTTGIEALILGKPVITFGHEFYAIEGITTVIRDFWDLPDAVFKIIEGSNYTWDNNIVKRYIYNYYKSTVPIEINIDLDTGTPLPSLSKESAFKLAEDIVFWYKHKE